MKFESAAARRSFVDSGGNKDERQRKPPLSTARTRSVTSGGGLLSAEWIGRSLKTQPPRGGVGVTASAVGKQREAILKFNQSLC